MITYFSKWNHGSLLLPRTQYAISQAAIPSRMHQTHEDLPNFFRFRFISSSVPSLYPYSHERVHDSTTVYALATGNYSKCAVAVVRITGSQSSEVLKQLTLQKPLPPPRQATLRGLYDPQTKDKLDMALALWFPSERSAVIVLTRSRAQ